MDSAGELTNLESSNGGEEPPSSDKEKTFDKLINEDWTPIQKFTRKFPKVASFIVRTVGAFIFFSDRCGTFVSATVFCVFLPLVPTVLYVLKNGSISRETLMTTGIMQILSFLNSDSKCGGMAVFVMYVIGLLFCISVQDWSLSPTLTVKSWDECVQYVFCPNLINGHALDSFVILGILGTGMLNCLSVFKTYGIGFENHWFWEDVKQLRKKKETTKLLKEDSPK